MRRRKYFRLPEFFVEKYKLIIEISISVLFALTFLVAYSPYSNTAWFTNSASEHYMLTAFFVIVSTLMLICSRMLMFFLSKKVITFTYLKFVLWLLAEIIIIGAFHAVISKNLVYHDAHTFVFLLSKSVLITFIALGFPFIVINLCFALYNSQKKLLLTRTHNVASDGEAIARNMDIINIADNNGVLRLSVKLDNLYYIKSDDNYVNVFYTKKGELTSYMLRCKLQTIEDTFKKSPLMRCHRSYIVNTNKVKVLRSESDGFFMDFDCEGIDPIPVSKTYSEVVVERFSGMGR